MDTEKHDFLVIGAGAGGATVARELALRGRSVVVLERGVPPAHVGTYKDATGFYDGNSVTHIPRHSAEGVTIWHTFMPGGTTVVACGNFTRCLERELAELGIDLSRELAEAEADVGVAPCSAELLSEGTWAIKEAASRLGYKMDLMPKGIDPARCDRCGHCVLGCRHGAKWTAERYLDEARDHGAEVMTGVRVDRVLSANGHVTGVRARNGKAEHDILADTVILAAGGLDTPVVLLRSGISAAGGNLFTDLFVNTYGVTDHLGQVREPVMGLVDTEFHDERGFILSPFVNHSRRVRFLEASTRGFGLPLERLLGIMTKITDEPVGRVMADGALSKPVTARDRARLDEGSALCREILVGAGARPDSILVSSVQGGHPGGTAAIDTVVDRDLQTEIDGLFVCDASVLPTAPGLPPILTIMALGKRLGKTLAA